MRGDQLARQWRIIRAIEASPNGLTVTEIAQREEPGIRTVYRDLEALQAAGFPLYTERVERASRWAFTDTFKFKIPSPFTPTELMSLYFCKRLYKDINRILKGIPIFDIVDSIFKRVQAILFIRCPGGDKIRGAVLVGRRKDSGRRVNFTGLDWPARE
jgi:hypothetical protein